jgi:hypothetical protein
VAKAVLRGVDPDKTRIRKLADVSPFRAGTSLDFARGYLRDGMTVTAYRQEIQRRFTTSGRRGIGFPGLLHNFVAVNRIARLET